MALDLQPPTPGSARSSRGRRIPEVRPSGLLEAAAAEVRPPSSGGQSQRGSNGIPSPNKARTRQSIQQAIANAEQEMTIKKPPHPGTFFPESKGGYADPYGGLKKPGEGVRNQTPADE